MKKITIAMLALSGIVFLNSCSTTKTVTQTETTTVENTEMKEAGLNLSYMDSSVRPQDDFFNYVNGNWMKTAEIPSDKTSWGNYKKIREDVDVASLGILDKI